MKKKIAKIVIVTLIILAIIIGIPTAVIMKRKYDKKYKHINVKQIKIIDYINVADEASKDKLQVNWKQMAAIDGVRYKNDFSQSSEEAKVELANMFLEENKGENKVKNSEYRLKNLEEVMTKLNFEEKQVKKTYDYLKDLDNVGLVKEELQPDSKYVEFINDIKEGAIDGYKKYGILPSVTIAQAILESGWGDSELTTKANNLFGIKADKSWKGPKVDMKTSEYNNKVITDSFRVYNNKSESIKDHREFLYNNPRYRKSGVFEAAHYMEQAKAIENAGYSTVENQKGQKIYSDMIISLIREYNLQLIDYDAQMSYLKGEFK